MLVYACIYMFFSIDLPKLKTIKNTKEKNKKKPNRRQNEILSLNLLVNLFRS